jgi:hypothetical protein
MNTTIIMCYGPEIRFHCRVPDCGAYIDRAWTLERQCGVPKAGLPCTIRRPTLSVHDHSTKICQLDMWIQRLEALEMMEATEAIAALEREIHEEEDGEGQGYDDMPGSWI